MRDFFTKDIGWKIFSLALALVIWLAVSKPLESSTMRTFSGVPVLVVSAAADVREFKVNPSSVQVTVSGNLETMSTLEPKQIHVIVDLTGVEAAQDLKKPVHVSTLPGLTVVRVVPAEADVIVPPKAKK